MAKILVIEDEKDVVTLIKFLLGRDGHEVTFAYDGSAALELLGVEPVNAEASLPDLILLDVMMPVMDGRAVCKHLVDCERTKKIPLVILTAQGQVGGIFDTSPNVAAQLQKPFDPQNLRDEVNQILKKHQDNA